MRDQYSNRIYNYMFLLIVLLMASTVIFYKLGDGSIWRDEAFSVELSKQSYSTISYVLTSIEGNMFLYYLVLHLWLSVLSIFHIPWTAFWVRIPNALAFIASEMVLYLLSIELFKKRWIGAFTVFVTLGYPYLISYSQQARAFTFFLLFTTLSFYALLKYIRADGISMLWWGLYLFFSILDLYSFLNSVFYFGAQFILMTLLMSTRVFNSRKYLVYVLALVSGAVAALPLLHPILLGGQVGWVPVPTLHGALHLLDNYMVLHMKSPLGILETMLVVIGVGAFLFRRGPTWLSEIRDSRFGLLVAIVFTFVSPIEAFVVSHIKGYHVFSPDYLLPTTFGLALLCSGAVAVWSHRSIRLALFIISLLIILPHAGRGQGLSFEQWKQPVLTWAEKYQSGQRVIAINNNQGIQYTLQYFIDAYNLPINIGSYPGNFTWVQYTKIDEKGSYFQKAANIKALQSASILKKGNTVWFALNGYNSSRWHRLHNWLGRHAILERKIAHKGWAVSFWEYRIN